MPISGSMFIWICSQQLPENSVKIFRSEICALTQPKPNIPISIYHSPTQSSQRGGVTGQMIYFIAITHRSFAHICALRLNNTPPLVPWEAHASGLSKFIAGLLQIFQGGIFLNAS